MIFYLRRGLLKYLLIPLLRGPTHSRPMITGLAKRPPTSYSNGSPIILAQGFSGGQYSREVPSYLLFV